MAIVEFNQRVSWDGSSGVMLGPVEIQSAGLHSALYVQCSTLATASSFTFQTAPSSNGPWVSEGSTTISTAAAAAYLLRLTGPYQFMRSYTETKSTGTHFVTLIVVG